MGYISRLYNVRGEQVGTGSQKLFEVFKNYERRVLKKPLKLCNLEIKHILNSKVKEELKTATLLIIAAPIVPCCVCVHWGCIKEAS